MNNIIAINQVRTEMASERYKALTEQKFGRVTVIGFADINDNGVRRVLVQCDCGNEYPMTAIYLVKIKDTQCQRCSQIIRNRGVKGYKEFLDKQDFWINKKSRDSQTRSLRSE